MKELVLFSVTVIMGFFAIMNPVGNTPIYLGLVEGLDHTASRRVARRSVLAAFAIVTVFTVFGGIIFKLFGITLPAFQIAAGILVFLVGYELVHARTSRIQHPPSGGTSGAYEAEDVAVTPLAMPILAGPGTISTAMQFAGTKASVLHTAIVVLLFGVACAVTYVCFVLGERLLSFLGTGIVRVITRLMGLILAVLSVQMIISGVTNAIQMYR